MKIKTEQINPPIPVNHFDWSAWIDGEEEFGYTGRGETEQDAISDLVENHLDGKGVKFYKMEHLISDGNWYINPSGTKFVNEYIDDKNFEGLGKYLNAMDPKFRLTICD